MPFTPYKSSLDPSALATAQEAFDLAWTEILTLPDAHDEVLARNLLAKRIVEAAMDGERDPAKLKAYALEGITSREHA